MLVSEVHWWYLPILIPIFLERDYNFVDSLVNVYKDYMHLLNGMRLCLRINVSVSVLIGGASSVVHESGGGTGRGPGAWAHQRIERKPSQKHMEGCTMIYNDGDNELID